MNDRGLKLLIFVIAATSITSMLSIAAYVTLEVASNPYALIAAACLIFAAITGSVAIISMATGDAL